MGERIIWIIICLILVIALGIVINWGDTPRQEEMDSYATGLTQLEMKIDSLRNVITEMESGRAETNAVSEYPSTAEEEPGSEQSGRSGVLQSFEVRQFRERGLENPEQEIIDDLYNNPQLIPHEGVLGGTMRFHSKDDLTLINSRWAFARYEDGHITGEMLLEYDVNPNGTISWNVLRATDL
jgi:hypothetical protein